MLPPTVVLNFPLIHTVSRQDAFKHNILQDGPSTRKQRRGRAMDWTVTDEIGFD